MHTLVKESRSSCPTYYLMSWWGLSQILVHGSRIMVGQEVEFERNHEVARGISVDEEYR